MGKIMREVYYPEPRVIAEGKYSRELSVESLLEFLKKSKDDLGIALKEIRVKYDKRKDGVVVRRIVYENGEPNYRFKYNPLCDKTEIFYAATKKEPAKKVVLDENGKEDQ